MVNDAINLENIGYAFVVCGLFLSVAFYIASIAYGVHRLEKSVNDLEALLVKPTKQNRSLPRTKAKTTGTKRKTNAKRN